MDALQYFSECSSPQKKKYDALRDFYFQGHRAADVAKKYGYTLSAFYSLSKEFRNHLKTEDFQYLLFIYQMLSASFTSRFPVMA